MATQMNALQKSGGSVHVMASLMPTIGRDDDVIIRVALSGICRTDVFAAEGRIRTPDPIVLGHEFAGFVEAAGDAAGLTPGERVTVMPIMPCGACEWCGCGKAELCQHTTMLGIDRDGSFGEFIRVPASSVYKMPAGMSFRAGAYAEPVAAAMSVLRAGLDPAEKGVIYGNNRFGQLIHRIFAAKGFENVTIFDPNAGAQMPVNGYDFAVETLATTETISALVRAVRPQGKIVLKSRKPEAVGIHFVDAIKKELTFRAVNYGNFDETLALMAAGALRLDDLLGDVHPLDNFSAVFERSKTHEERKTFFGLMEKDVWDC